MYCLIRNNRARVTGKSIFSGLNLGFSGGSYPKNKYDINIAAITPAKSAIKPAGIAYRDFFIPTEPKYSATI